MKHIKKFESFSYSVNEGLFSWLFGKKDDKAPIQAPEEENYIMFQGKKYYNDDIEYASYQDLGQIPRVEGGKLIIANPAWSE